MKKISLVLCLIFCLPFLLFGCESASESKTSYSILASFDDEEKSLACNEKIIYNNSSDNALDKVCFFVYANAFAQEQKPVATSYENKAYPNGKDYGGLDLHSVFVNGQAGESSFSEKGNILTVTLYDTLFADESVEVELNFTVFLANIHHRLGYGENTINFGNFFPIACVYDEGFVKNEFSSNGDPFYSEVADFEVEISYPQKYDIATSGTCQTAGDGLTKTTTCVAKNVRDFCFVLSEKFEKISCDVDGIEVIYFGYDDADAQHFLEISAKAVQTFSELFGKYPYKTLSVVKTNFCFGGMEYPNLVYISDDVESVEMFDYCIVHEIAHQWWYGIVGNNEFQDAWLDEGLTEFSTALFFEKNAQYGFDYDTIMQNARDSYVNFVNIYTKITGDCDQSMQRSLAEFSTEPEYVNCTYTKGMLLFASLRDCLGKRKFEKCLKQYFKQYEFKNSAPELLIESFSKTAKINLLSFFSSWLNGTVVIN